MLDKKVLRKVNDILWEIPKSYRFDMRVPARVFATEKMLSDALTDRSLEQLVNITTLPGIVKAAYAMPDTHEGYGFPIGGVAATKYPDGVISPGGIGFDINCGVRLLQSQMTTEEITPHLEKLAQELNREIPSGVGQGGRLKLDNKKLDQVLKEGVSWVVAQGYGDTDDLKHIESNGSLKEADPDKVSDHAKNRGRDQLGTMGAGNHFVEIDRVDEIFLEETAKAFGLFKDQIVILIHCGSRGLGHQAATDYIHKMHAAMPKYGISVPDSQLACAPFNSPEGKDYFAAMSAAANFAWSNRQLITWEVRNVWARRFGKDADLKILYDVSHNIAKIEEHEVDGGSHRVIVHRKGATRAFGPGNPELAAEYQKFGQPVIIPGSMGTVSYVLVGTNEGMAQSFGSSCHGAGRRMSRTAARKQFDIGKLKKELRDKGIYIHGGSLRGLVEEAPLAYKDVHDVVDVVHSAGIAKKVARLRPLVVVKG